MSQSLEIILEDSLKSAKQNSEMKELEQKIKEYSPDYFSDYFSRIVMVLFSHCSHILMYKVG